MNVEMLVFVILFEAIICYENKKSRKFQKIWYFQAVQYVIEGEYRRHCHFVGFCRRAASVIRILHDILSPHEDQGILFSGPVVGLPFHMDNEGTPPHGRSHNQRFLWGKSSTNFFPNGKFTTQLCKGEFNKLSLRSLHNRQIVTSDVLRSL